MKTLIKNGRVIDPSQNIDAIMDLLVEDGVIKEVAAEIKAAADEVYDADGLIVAPRVWLTCIHICVNRARKLRKIS